jgi:hypothetical protein
LTRDEHGGAVRGFDRRAGAAADDLHVVAADVHVLETRSGDHDVHARRDLRLPVIEHVRNGLACCAIHLSDVDVLVPPMFEQRRAQRVELRSQRRDGGFQVTHALRNTLRLSVGRERQDERTHQKNPEWFMHGAGS